MSLVPIAAEFDNSIPVHADASFCAAQGISQMEYLRLRLNTHWMVRCKNV
jgi:hypothetical protein